MKQTKNNEKKSLTLKIIILVTKILNYPYSIEQRNDRPN